MRLIKSFKQKTKSTTIENKIRTLENNSINENISKLQKQTFFNFTTNGLMSILWEELVYTMDSFLSEQYDQ